MASRRWVVNASPLILLGKTDNLHLLAALADVVTIPRAVAKEVGNKPDGEAMLQALAANPTFVRADDEPVSPEIFDWDLGEGETQVIANARCHGADRVVIDDLKARRCAKTMGLRVIGTLGIVGRAKASGLIERVEPTIKHLRETGLYVSEELVRLILREVDK
ncbi:DUF3368 domain-containing protein [Candidatus Thiosymbion oneisti]|uniref:DUF3368 domain-containing protein n=1 Tax=Candidatus Thiosymbion oneisti TaxID=589554 RepID=UPI0010608640|nr:DUF3368 domain-containing protein [Candidatus Thiosymbion oneisti]